MSPTINAIEFFLCQYYPMHSHAVNESTCSILIIGSSIKINKNGEEFPLPERIMRNFEWYFGYIPSHLIFFGLS